MEAQWARCRPWLEPAMRDGWTAERVRAEVEAGRAQLWPGARSAVVTEVTRDLHLWLAGGALDELLRMQPSAQAHARAWGCERMTLIGRPGWRRVLAPHGWRHLNMLVKDL